MTSQEVFLEVTQMVNRNITNNNASLDRLRFVLLYNSIETRYVEWVLEKRNEDYLRYVSLLLKQGKELSLESETDMYQAYKLPDDFFDHSNLRAYAKSACGAVKLRTHEVKNDDIEELYHDVNHEPSVEYEDTFYH